jgi:hypothetical protein
LAYLTEIIKPEILPLSEDFILIDFKVLMAFIISTIGCNESLGSLIWGFSTYTDKDEFVFDAGGAERVEIYVRDQYLITHIFAERCRPWTPSGKKRYSPRTKPEIENLLIAIPPFYFAVVTRQNRKTLALSIHSMETFRRAGGFRP